MKNLLSMEHVTPQEIEALITRAIDIKNGRPVMKLNDKTVVNLFYENSTRTKLSFEMAEKKLNVERLPLPRAPRRPAVLRYKRVSYFPELL